MIRHEREKRETSTSEPNPYSIIFPTDPQSLRDTMKELDRRRGETGFLAYRAEEELMDDQNPHAYNSRENFYNLLSKYGSENAINAFAWGNIVSYNSIRRTAQERGIELPRLSQQFVDEFSEKVRPAIEMLVGFVQRGDDKPIYVSRKDSDILLAFAGRLKTLDPEFSDSLSASLDIAEIEQESDIPLLLETHPTYLGAAYQYLLLYEGLQDPKNFEVFETTPNQETIAAFDTRTVYFARTAELVQLGASGILPYVDLLGKVRGPNEADYKKNFSMAGVFNKGGLHPGSNQAEMMIFGETTEGVIQELLKLPDEVPTRTTKRKKADKNAQAKAEKLIREGILPVIAVLIEKLEDGTNAVRLTHSNRVSPNMAIDLIKEGLTNNYEVLLPSKPPLVN